MIDWLKEDSHIFINPKLPQDKQNLARKAFDEHSGSREVWLQSSGTESGSKFLKFIILPKSSILSAAQAVVDFLGINESDIWLNPLPSFHIGGLSISARCFVSDSKEVVYSKRWNPSDFHNAIIQSNATITSLVPTQIFDLIDSELKCPDSLRKVIVGGGALDENLYTKAKDLGWPLIISYGMTETSALMACSQLNDKRPEMKFLSHIKIEEMGSKVKIQSDALFSAMVLVSKDSVDVQKRIGSFELDDRLEISNGTVKVLGRETELVKILGETVNLAKLEKQISRMLSKNVVIQPVPHERNGYELKVWVESADEAIDIDKLNSQVMPYERVSEFENISLFPRTALGKIQKSQIFK